MTELGDQEWRLIREEAWDGPMNMALDEIAAETTANGGPPTVRVYKWQPSTLSLGYDQDSATIDWDYCEREGITVTRRQTGGGAIYHDNYGDISYSITAPATELPGNLMETYKLLCEPVLEAFGEMGVVADFANEEQPEIHKPACYLRKLHPAHDVVATDGRKISGNAQYRQRDSIIQHGSLTYESQPNQHLSVFTADDLSQAEFSDRVTSIHEQTGCSRSEAVKALESALADWSNADVSEWTDDELARARKRANRKYDTDHWNHKRNDLSE